MSLDLTINISLVYRVVQKDFCMFENSRSSAACGLACQCGIVPVVSCCDWTDELALALSVKRYTFPNDYTRSMKVNTAVELPVQETFQLCSAMHSSVTLLLLLSENWSSQQLTTGTIPHCFPSTPINRNSDKSSRVHFAQINGMGDHLTHGLAANGFSCLKLVPCGSVSDVMPWLARCLLTTDKFIYIINQSLHG